MAFAWKRLYGVMALLFPRVVKTAADLGDIEFDYVICANRLTMRDHGTMIQSIRQNIKPKTIIVTAQNGIGMEQALAEAFPLNPIISAICYVNLAETSPGVVRQLSTLDRSVAYKFGGVESEYSTTRLERSKLKDLVSLDSSFAEAENMKVERWTKMVINAAWNPATAIFDLDTHQLITESGYGLTLVMRLMEEVYQIGVADGLPLPADTPSRGLEMVRKTGPMVTSMLRDARLKRTMEIETICGRHGPSSTAVDLLIWSIPFPRQRMETGRSSPYSRTDIKNGISNTEVDESFFQQKYVPSH